MRVMFDRDNKQKKNILHIQQTSFDYTILFDEQKVQWIPSNTSTENKKKETINESSLQFPPLLIRTIRQPKPFI
jgi:hypothetical protein